MSNIERKLVIIWKEPKCNIRVRARSFVRWFVDSKLVGGGLIVAGRVEPLRVGGWSIYYIEGPAVRVNWLRNDGAENESDAMGAYGSFKEDAYNPPVP
jgi:hypothetical protein